MSRKIAYFAVLLIFYICAKVVIANDQSRALFFKLKTNNFEELFDGMSLKELVALAKTPKRMQHIIGHHIATNYGATYPEYRENYISKSDEFSRDRIKLNRMSSFLRKLVFFTLEYNS